ncbi:serine/threonine-protein kinase [Trichophyton mentagrophytes]|nr:serine/threonine-protein kinase [Trichophyton mentagrophytes]
MARADTGKRITQFPASKAAGFTGLPVSKLNVTQAQTAQRKQASNKTRRNLQRRMPQDADRYPILRPPATSENYLCTRCGCQQGEPWAVYRRFIEEDQAGGAVIAHTMNPAFDLVAVKERKIVASKATNSLRTAFHSNIVCLNEIFENEGVVFLIYEYIDYSHVSLGDLGNSLGHPLNEVELAAICKQALDGLSYIHKKLGIVHGDINDENILFAQSGMLKIG